MSPLLPPGACLHLLSRIGFSNPTARRFFRRLLLTHAPTLSARQFVHKAKHLRIYTSMHSGGLELKKLIYTKLEDNLIRHRRGLYIRPRNTSGIRLQYSCGVTCSMKSVYPVCPLQLSFYCSAKMKHATICTKIDTIVVCRVSIPSPRRRIRLSSSLV